MNHPFPPSFITAESLLVDVFHDEAAGLGIGRFDSEQLLKKIPASVRSTKAIKFVFDQEWRYIFGKQFHFDGNSRGFGVPHQAPLVANLVRASALADRVLTASQFRRWWQQLDIPAKHLDAIVEMLSISNVALDHDLAYEQAGLGIGSQKIDWLLKTKEKGGFLLEVKNRPGQMAREMTRRKATSPSMPSDPITDFPALFRSTTGKFLPLNETEYTQGVILFLGIKVPATALDNYFRNHLQSHLHFIALGKEDKAMGISVNLFVKSTEIADHVRFAFRWSEGADLLY